MNKKKIRSCVLTRVSTKMEVQLSSLKFQNDTLIDFVKKQKDEIFDEKLDVFSDQVTGTKIFKGNNNDQGFDTLMRLLNITISDYDCKDFTKVSIEFDKTKTPKYNKIYCKSTSRINRAGAKGQSLLEILKANGIEVYFYDLNKCLSQMSDVEIAVFTMSDHSYSKTMSSNTRLNKIYKTNNRELMLHNVRFGWDLVKENGHRAYRKNEEEKAILDLIIKLFLDEDLGCNLISQKLEEMGLKSTKTKFDPSQIQRILKDKHYCGLEKYYDYPEDYKNQFQVDRSYLKNLNCSWLRCEYIDILIPQETYDKIQEKFQSRTSQGRGVKQRKLELSKKLICGSCGSHYYSLGSCNYFKEQAFKCSSKRSVQQKKKVACDSETFYINYFNEWAKRQANNLPQRLDDMCREGVQNLLHLEHHLALVLNNNNFDKFEEWNEEREKLKSDLEDKIALLIQNSSSETMDIVLKFQRKIEDEIKVLTKKINTFMSLKEEVISAIQELRHIEEELFELQNTIKKSYTIEEFIDECEMIVVYKKTSEKRHRNRCIFISQLKLENEIFELITTILNSEIMDFLEPKTINLSEIKYHKRYVIRKLSDEMLEVSNQILETLEI